jgi:glycosyltransferase involved in cell wall biosynthesis
MHVLIHDYSGHPFPVELSRELAKRGYTVTHVYCESFTAPRGFMKKTKDDPDNFSIIPILLPKPVPKFSFFGRWYWDKKYGEKLIQIIQSLSFDLVISGNAPLEAQKLLLSYCKAHGIPFVFWIQDLIGEAIYRIVSSKIPILGNIVGSYYQWLEKRLFHQSDHLIAISPGFLPYLGEGNQKKCSVIQNWAPQHLLQQVPKSNPWSQKNHLADKFVFLYSGTLGFKHNPNFLLALARTFQSIPEVQVVVNSEGNAAQWLKTQAQKRGLPNLLVNPFQPIEQLPMVLATADVLIVLLESDAGVFSVPSKVYSYFCAGKPILMAAPFQNLASQLVFQTHAGIVVPPDDEKAFLKQAHFLYTHPEIRKEMGQLGFAYAKEHLQIQKITNQFEEIILSISPHVPLLKK